MLRRATVEVAGRPARYIAAGAGPAVVFVHGLGLSGGFFRSHCKAFARAGFLALAPDLPGFGRSPGPRFGLSVAETAEWLVALASELGLGRVVWVGHSLAAQATLEAAVLAPSRTRALVLVTPTGAPGRCRLLRQFRSFVRDMWREPIALAPVVARHYIHGSPTAFLGTWIRAARHRPSRTAPRVRCPTLVVAGKRDPVVPNHFVDMLIRRIPGAKLARIHGAGHGITFDRPEDFDRVVLAFLREVLARPDGGTGIARSA